MDASNVTFISAAVLGASGVYCCCCRSRQPEIRLTTGYWGIRGLGGE
jgi:hypothetical protein